MTGLDELRALSDSDLLQEAFWVQESDWVIDDVDAEIARRLATRLAVVDAAADVLAYIEILERIAYDEVFDPSSHQMVAPFADAVAAVKEGER